MSDAIGVKRTVTKVVEVFMPARTAGAFDMESIGAAVKAARDAAGFTQGAVAEAAGVTTGVVCGVEAGNRDPRLCNFAAICYVLGLDAGKLLRENMDKPESKPAE